MTLKWHTYTNAHIHIFRWTLTSRNPIRSCQFLEATNISRWRITSCWNMQLKLLPCAHPAAPTGQTENQPLLCWRMSVISNQRLVRQPATIFPPLLFLSSLRRSIGSLHRLTVIGCDGAGIPRVVHWWQFNLVFTLSLSPVASATQAIYFTFFADVFSLKVVYYKTYLCLTV